MTATEATPAATTPATTTPVQRVCALCLKSLATDQIKTCGGCKRRTYCSRECQAADWTLASYGQGHKSWCALKCGEEGIDWKVCELPGRGQGVVALKDIPAGFRVMVDRAQLKPTSHPGIKDMAPVGGTPQQIFDLNCLGADNGENVVGVRACRCNHACNANLARHYDKERKVLIVSAERDIKAGEELCINYVLSCGMYRDITEEAARKRLQEKWGIECPSDCICYDKDLSALAKLGVTLDGIMVNRYQQGDVVGAFETAQQLLEIVEKLGTNVSMGTRSRTLFSAAQLAFNRKETTPQGVEYLRKSHALKKAVLHPSSNEIEESEKFLKAYTSA